MEIIRRDELQELLEVVRMNPYGKFLITGTAGSGKTFLLNIIGKILEEQGKEIWYETMAFSQMGNRIWKHPSEFADVVCLVDGLDEIYRYKQQMVEHIKNARGCYICTATDNEICVILLSSHIGIDKESDVKPFSLGEWNKFLEALIEAKLQPSIAYHMTDEDAKSLGYDHAFTERIKKLVDRGAAVSFELQEYEKKGIQVITEINKDYPIMLRRQLQKKKPPVLFYAGNLDLAKNVGIGVVGSRNISIKGVDFTKELVSKATGENLIVYSGGAKGVDNISETVALHAGGAVVSYLADSLVSKIKKPAVATNIASGKLLLLSDQKPDVGFSVGRAMNRNKFIYASGYGTFVIESDYNKGGTWAGATEAIKNNWGKVFVWDNEMEGNKKLIEAGGIPFLLDEKQRIYDVVNQDIPQNSSENETETYEQMDLSAFLKQ